MFNEELLQLLRCALYTVSYLIVSLYFQRRESKPCLNKSEYLLVTSIQQAHCLLNFSVKQTVIRSGQNFGDVDSSCIFSLGSSSRFLEFNGMKVKSMNWM